MHTAAYSGMCERRYAADFRLIDVLKLDDESGIGSKPWACNYSGPHVARHAACCPSVPRCMDTC